MNTSKHGGQSANIIHTSGKRERERAGHSYYFILNQGDIAEARMPGEKNDESYRRTPDIKGWSFIVAPAVL